MFRAPCKVASVKTKGTVFGVTSASADGVNALGSKFGVSWLTTELELALLAVVGALRSRGRALVPRRTRDTHA